MKSSNPIVNRALAYVGQRRAANEVLRAGDRVKVVRGPMAGRTGIVRKPAKSAFDCHEIEIDGKVYASMCDAGEIVKNAAAKVGDMVVYGGGPHVVVKDLGGGKYVLRSRSTGRSFAVTAPKGFDVLEPGSYALNRGNACGK